MIKLDNQCRITVPKRLFYITKIDLNKPIGIYLEGNYFFLDNVDNPDNEYPCVGEICINQKGRFTIPKPVREILKLENQTELVCFVYKKRITLGKNFPF